MIFPRLGSLLTLSLNCNLCINELVTVPVSKLASSASSQVTIYNFTILGRINGLVVGFSRDVGITSSALQGISAIKSPLIR